MSRIGDILRAYIRWAETSEYKSHMFVCPFCNNRKKEYHWIERPRFSIDRYGRSRVKAVVRCLNCRMELVTMRDSHSPDWKWDERG